METIKKTENFNNTIDLENIKNNVDPIKSDKFHLIEFSKMKITKWIYAPISGLILYFCIFKIFCNANLIDRKKAHKDGGKFCLALFLLPLSLVMVFSILLIIILTLDSLANLTELEKTLYSIIPLLVSFVISPFISFVVKKNVKKIFKINDSDEKFSCNIVYRNAQIFDNSEYFRKLQKSPNQKLLGFFLKQDFFLSQNFTGIHKPPLTINYEGTKMQARDLSTVRQRENIDITWFLIPLGYIVLFLAKYFNYFFFCNILAQKVKNDDKNNLFRKINWVIFFNYCFTIIFWTSFIFLMILPATKIPYFTNPTEKTSASDLLNSIILHWVYCLVFFVSFTLVTFLRSQLTKKLVVKMCLKEYSKKITN